MKTWDEMTPRERDMAVAERVMGLTATLRWCLRDPGCGGWDECESIREETDDYTDVTWYAQQPCYQPYPHNDAVWRVVPAYTTDYADARLVEDEIERRKLGVAYTRALVEIVWSVRHSTRGSLTPFHWSLIRATPEERCHAAWLAVREVAHEGV